MSINKIYTFSYKNKWVGIVICDNNYKLPWQYRCAITVINIEITSQSAIIFIVHSNNLQIRSLYASDDAVYVHNKRFVKNLQLLVNKMFK